MYVKGVVLLNRALCCKSNSERSHFVNDDVIWFLLPIRPHCITARHFVKLEDSFYYEQHKYNNNE
jgi:hypothetical protein